MNRRMTAFLTSAALLMACFTLSACNTVQGVGKDVKSVGGAIERAAK